MSGEINKLNIGKQQVELGKDKGIQRSAFGDNEVAKSIFDKYDKDGNAILDEQELAQMNADLAKAAAQKGSKTSLGKNEAKAYMQNLGIETDNAREEIQNFLAVLGSTKDQVEKAEKLANGDVRVQYASTAGGGGN